MCITVVKVKITETQVGVCTEYFDERNRDCILFIFRMVQQIRITEDSLYEICRHKNTNMDAQVIGQGR